MHLNDSTLETLTNTFPAISVFDLSFWHEPEENLPIKVMDAMTSEQVTLRRLSWRSSNKESKLSR